MRIIYKYKLANTSDVAPWSRHSITLPAKHQFMKVDVQYDSIVLWALICPDCKEDVTVDFVIQGTGVEFDYDPDKLMYVDTVQVKTMNIETGVHTLVWHIFEIAED